MHVAPCMLVVHLCTHGRLVNAVSRCTSIQAVHEQDHSYRTSLDLVLAATSITSSPPTMDESARCFACLLAITGSTRHQYSKNMVKPPIAQQLTHREHHGMHTYCRRALQPIAQADPSFLRLLQASSEPSFGQCFPACRDAVTGTMS